MALCVMLLAYIGCYIYRYVLIADTVEELRSTYHEQFISITFVAYWDQVRDFLARLLHVSVPVRIVCEKISVCGHPNLLLTLNPQTHPGPPPLRWNVSF